MDELDSSVVEEQFTDDFVIDQVGRHIVVDSAVRTNNKDDLMWVENEIVVAEDVSETLGLLNERGSSNDTVEVTLGVAEDNGSDREEEPQIVDLEEEQVSHIGVENTKLWKYFTQHNSSQLKCNFCSGLFIYQSNDSQLLSHVEAAHQVATGVALNNLPSASESQVPSDDKSNKKLSADRTNDEWLNTEEGGKYLRYFTRLDSGKFRCNLCCRIPYDVQQSTVCRHFKSCHPDVYTSISGLKIVKPWAKWNHSGSATSQLINFLADHFTKLKMPNKIKCNQCQSILKYSAYKHNNLVRHLKKKHPESLAEINGNLSQHFGLEIDDVHFNEEENFSTIVVEAIEDGKNNFVADANSTIKKYMVLNKSSPMVNVKDSKIELSQGNLKLNLKDTCKEGATENLSEIGSQERESSESIQGGKVVTRYKRSKHNSVSSFLWSYYTKLHRSKIMCAFCGDTFVYRLGHVTRPIRHLLARHWFTISSSRSAKLKDSSLEVKRLHSKDTIWKYFTVLDQTQAQCDLCEKPNVLVYSGSCISSLGEHLRRKHKYFLDFIFDDDKSNDVVHVAPVDSSKPNVDMKALYDYYVTDKKLRGSISYEDEQIVCRSCTGTFLFNDLINFESTIRYHVQNCHALVTNNPDSVFNETNVTSYYEDSVEPRQLYDSEYNELEAISDEVNSFDQ